MEHLDYGTLLLMLLNNGVEQLEAHVDGGWRPVPYIKGDAVVNVGSILSKYMGQELRATLHRVTNPASIVGKLSKDALMEAELVPRTLIAYFVDPIKDIATVLQGEGGSTMARTTGIATWKKMSQITCSGGRSERETVK